MGALKYRCPNSFHEVETSIRTDDPTLQQMRSLKLSLWCPHCATAHQIEASAAYINVADVIRGNFFASR